MPLLAWVFQLESLERSKNTLVHQMLDHLKGLLGDLVLVADRGFGHAWALHCCRQLGVEFVLRVKGDATIHAGGQRGPARQFVLPRGRRFYPHAYYHSAQKLPVNFIAIYSGNDPWLLITSLTDFPRAVKLYRKRREIEEFSGPQKPAGLGGSAGAQCAEAAGFIGSFAGGL